jgi:DnaA family protein
MSADVLLGLESLNLICLDDLHHISQYLEWEEAVFHLYNRVYDAGGCMIMAGNDLPRSLNMQLPDLVSRLSWGVIYQLQSLTDVEKQAILVKRADQRGIYLSDEVAKYLLTHCPRHMGALFAVLDVLDKASLAAKRRLTIPFVKEVLELS